VTPRADLATANAVYALTRNVPLLLGPAISGLLIAVSGPPAAYGADIATFFMSLLLLAQMRAVPPAPEAQRPSIRRVLEE